ncbi:hypothetical protein THASP1DRAFT_22672 [Thamnocephalis sphaerospora]|uniref:Uncharacterized protein n=1 Tax=Thamnocephalis sphaerospora TaxID=78915 RepID=A0A4P9XTI3_9FUNG|nr:hypothetical protein THASP1DRAFT_22672 [Thamnocephalis sphaerospora]|eukprot:RKP09488.1 hypothetical protein THASP1DRAFT_22672 [Thamnocephalis sphaerospora]
MPPPYGKAGKDRAQERRNKGERQRQSDESLPDKGQPPKANGSAVRLPRSARQARLCRQREQPSTQHGPGECTAAPTTLGERPAPHQNGGQAMCHGCLFGARQQDQASQHVSAGQSVHEASCESGQRHRRWWPTVLKHAPTVSPQMTNPTARLARSADAQTACTDEQAGRIVRDKGQPPIWRPVAKEYKTAVPQPSATCYAICMHVLIAAASMAVHHRRRTAMQPLLLAGMAARARTVGDRPMQRMERERERASKDDDRAN